MQTLFCNDSAFPFAVVGDTEMEAQRLIFSLHGTLYSTLFSYREKNCPINDIASMYNSPSLSFFLGPYQKKNYVRIQSTQQVVSKISGEVLFSRCSTSTASDFKK